MSGDRLTNEQTLEVVVQHVRAAVAEAQDDDGIVLIQAAMLSTLLEGLDRLDKKCGALALLLYGTPENPRTPLAPGGSQTQPNTAVGESGTAAASPAVLEFLRSFIAGGVNQDFKPWARELYQKLYRSQDEPLSEHRSGCDSGGYVERNGFLVCSGCGKTAGEIFEAAHQRAVNRGEKP